MIFNGHTLKVKGDPGVYSSEKGKHSPSKPKRDLH